MEDNNIRKNSKIPKIIIIILLILILVLICLMINFFRNVFITASLKDLYGIQSDIICVIDSNVADGAILHSDNQIYIDTDTIKEYIDKYILWEPEKDKLTITTKNEVLKINTESNTYSSNNNEIALEMPYISQNNKAYLSVAALEKAYNLTCTLNKDILNIETNNRQKTIAKVKGPYRNLNYLPEEKSANTAIVKGNEEIELFGTSGNFYMAKNSQGIIGYIDKKYIETTRTIPIANETVSKQLWYPSNGKINMVFDQIFKSGDKRSDESRNVIHDGIDILCPTWFSFEQESCEIHNIADEKYVENAHKNGYQVWALITDNFTPSISHSVLATSDSREYVIKQIAAFCKIYNLDGINIDFEAVKKDDGENFVLFMRELAPILHEQGVVLSVDVYKPMVWSMYYRRDELAEAADYIIVMGYDEHYAGCEESGSVASYDWSVSSIESMLEIGIDKNKLILGIPFYTRIWTETPENGVSSKAFGMQESYDFMKEKGGEFQWDDKTGQYYCEVKEENKTYKLWWENADSVKNRADLVNKYDIAGCAAWKNNLETPDIWGVLKRSLGKK